MSYWRVLMISYDVLIFVFVLFRVLDGPSPACLAFFYWRSQFILAPL